MENSFEICHLPSNVQGMIYGYLGVDEYLSLRRTCKETKTWLETMDEKVSELDKNSRIRAQKRWKNFQYIIQEWDLSYGSRFKELLEFVFVNNVTNFWIQNTIFVIYELPNFRKFLESCCHKIRQLKLGRFLDCVSDVEWSFFRALTTLEDLEFLAVTVFFKDGSDSKFSRIPSCLKNLRSLRFTWKIKLVIEGGEIPNLDNSWICNPLKYCPNLEMLKMPLIFYTIGNKSTSSLWDFGLGENVIHEDPIFIKNVIDSLRDSNWSGKLKYLEFQSRDFGIGTRDYTVPVGVLQELIDVCKSKDVKLLKIPTHFCQEIRHGECILSAVHSTSKNRALISPDLPNLESLDVETYPHEGIDDVIPDLTLRKRWPKLKSLSLALGTRLLSWNREYLTGASAQEIVNLLVDSEPRPELQNLKLKLTTALDRGCVTCARLLRAQSITTNFMNLINLSLVGWDTEDMEFAHLWEGLPHLETLSIDDCSTASDLAFIGMNPEKPSFLKLKSLKKLEINLTNMPGVTERFFKVLRHMEVKDLVLRSFSEFPENTVKCISALSKGKVATNMNKLILDLMGLSNLSKDEYVELKNRFRSVR